MGDRVSEAGTLRVRCGRGMRRAGWLGGVVWHGRRKESREEARKVERKKEGRKDGQREGVEWERFARVVTEPVCCTVGFSFIESEERCRYSDKNLTRFAEDHFSLEVKEGWIFPLYGGRECKFNASSLNRAAKRRKYRPLFLRGLRQ